MTLQTLPAAIQWPGLLRDYLGSPGGAFGTEVTVSSAGHYASRIFSAPRDMTLGYAAFRPATVTGTCTATLSLETVDATTGAPTGTVLGATNNAKATTGTLVASTWTPVTLGETASITKGQLFAFKVAYTSGTSFIITKAANIVTTFGLPYAYSGTTPAKLLNEPLIGALGTDSSTFYNLPGLLPFDGAATLNAFNNTNSAARGLLFQVPFKCRCVGMMWHGSTGVGDLTIMIQDNAGNELSSSSTAIDGDISNGATAVSFRRGFFDNAVTLSPATNYRAVLTPTSATNINITTFALNAAAYRDATPWGANCVYATYVASSWTDTATTTLPAIDILIDQLDDGATAGGGTKSMGMTGGFDG